MQWWWSNGTYIFDCNICYSKCQFVIQTFYIVWMHKNIVTIFKYSIILHYYILYIFLTSAKSLFKCVFWKFSLLGYRRKTFITEKIFPASSLYSLIVNLTNKFSLDFSWCCRNLKSLGLIIFTTRHHSRCVLEQVERF